MEISHCSFTYLHLCFYYWDMTKCLPMRSAVHKEKLHAFRGHRWPLPWSSRHHRAAGLCAELGDGAVEHIDLVEEIHR